MRCSGLLYDGSPRFPQASDHPCWGAPRVSSRRRSEQPQRPRSRLCVFHAQAAPGSFLDFYGSSDLTVRVLKVSSFVINTTTHKQHNNTHHNNTTTPQHHNTTTPQQPHHNHTTTATTATTTKMQHNTATTQRHTHHTHTNNTHTHHNTTHQQQHQATGFTGHWVHRSTSFSC